MRNCYTIALALLLPCAAWATFDEATSAYARKDFDTAYKNFLELAEEGQHISQFNVGVMHEEGLGVAKDYVEAVRWYEKSALQDYSPAQFNLGNLYRFGRGVPEDHAAAFRWWLSAAELGHAAAQHNVGLQYYMGDVVAKDVDKGRQWLRRAVANGSEASRKLLAIVDPDSDATPGPGATAKKSSGKQTPRSTPIRRDSPVVRVPLASADDGNSGAQRATAAVAKTEVVVPAKAAAVAPAGESWILQQRPENYSLALLASVDEKDVQAFLARHTFSERTAYFRFRRGSTNWYEAISGSFSERRAAIQALRQLPDAVRKNKPWVTRFRKLHKVIRESR